MDPVRDFLARKGYGAAPVQPAVPDAPRVDAVAEFLRTKRTEELETPAVEPTWGDTAVTAGLRVLPPLFGGTAAALLASPSGPGAIGAAVGAGGALAGAGETAAEAYEKWRGLRSEINPTQIATQTALGAIPLGKQAAGLRGLLKAGVKGGALGGVAVGATELAEGQDLDPAAIAAGVGLGTVLGGGAHSLAARLAKSRAARAAAELEAEGQRFTPSPVHPASETALADMLRGTGPAEPRPQFSRASGGEDLLPVGQRRPDLVEDFLINRAANDVPTPGARPRGSFRQYLMADADVQAGLTAEQNAAQAAQEAEWRALQKPSPEASPDLGTSLEQAAAAQERAVAAEAAAAADAKRSLLGVLRGELDTRRAVEADVAGAVARPEQAGLRSDFERMLNRDTPEAVAAREAERVRALPVEPTGDRTGGGFLPEGQPAAKTTLADTLRVEQAAADAQAAEAAAGRSRYERLKAALGFGKTKPQSALGAIIRPSGGRVIPLTVDERATLGEIRQTIGEEAPSWLHGENELDPFYEAVRAAGNPKWTNSDIRNGINRLMEGRENVYGRTALAVAKERFPAKGAPWQKGLRGLPRQEDMPETGFSRYAARDAEIQADAARERTAFERFMAPDEAPLEAGGATAPGGHMPQAGETRVGEAFSSYNRAKAEADRLVAAGRKVRVAGGHGFYEVVEAAAPDVPVAAPRVVREPGEEGFATPRAIGALAGGTVGGLTGAAQGETTEERIKYGALGALLGAGVGAAGMGRLTRRGETAADVLAGQQRTPVPKQTTERAEMRLGGVAEEMARKELPSAQNIPKDRVVQVERLRKQFRDQADDLARVLADPIDGDPGFAAQRRHSIPIALQKALADLVHVDATKPGAIGKLLNAEETIAYKDALTTLTAKVMSKAKALADEGIDVNNPPAIESMSDPQVMRLVDWQETRQWQETVFKTLWGSASEQGRALAANKIMARVRPSEIQVIREVMRKGKFSEDVLRAAKLWGNLDINDPVAVYRALKDAQQRSVWDKVSSYWMSNILSGIKTQERNILGNFTRFATNVVMKPLAAAPLDALKSTLTGKPRTFYAREAIEDLTGTLHATGKAWDDFWYTLKNGFSKEYLETAMELEGGFMPRQEFKGPLGTDEVWNPVNWPGRMLDAMDRAFYQLNAGAEMYSQSYTRAVNEAKRLKLTGGGRQDFVAKRAIELRKNPDLDLQKGVHQASLEATYREPEGEFGRLIQQMRRVVPGMNFVMPFVKTVSNIGRQGYEVTPLSLLVKGGKQLMGNERAWNRIGGEREAAMMQAKAVFGTAASAFFAYLAASGRLSGSGPSDRAQRAQLMASGWRPNSVKLDLPDAAAKALGATKSDDGQYWVNYSLLQPLAMPMSLVANSFESWNEQQASMTKAGKAKRAEQVAAQTISKVAKSALNQSYLQGMFTLVDAINNGQASADKLVQQIAQGFVPGAGFLRNVTQGVDPVIRDPEGVKQGVMANVPGLSQNVPPLLGRYGEPIERSGSPLRRFLGVPEVEPTTSDWIDKELNRLGVNVGNPTDRLTLPQWVKGDRKLTEEQAVLLRQARGRATRASLAMLMRTPGYARMPEWAKVQAVRRAINRGTNRAAAAARISFATGRPELLSRMMAPMDRAAAGSYEPGQRRGL